MSMSTLKPFTLPSSSTGTISPEAAEVVESLNRALISSNGLLLTVAPETA